MTIETLIKMHPLYDDNINISNNNDDGDRNLNKNAFIP